MIEERKQDRFQQVLIDQLMVLQQKVNQWWLYTLSDFKQPNKTPHNFLSNSNFIYNFRCTQLYVRKQTIHQGKENSDTSSYRTKNYRGSKVLQAKSVSKNKRLLIFFLCDALTLCSLQLPWMVYLNSATAVSERHITIIIEGRTIL